MSGAAFPVYEFRPLAPVSHRYAEGKWLEDDGQHDLAFISATGPPIGYAVSLPHHTNLRWQWVERSWRHNEPRHPRSNPWHYMLADGAHDWGRTWKGRDAHPNEVAARAAADENCRLLSCSNGRGPEFHLGDPYIAAGLVRERDSQRVVTFPEQLVCMYCGPVPYPERLARIPEGPVVSQVTP